ncbi:MAG: Gfo/Idh/MocA family oxidoreductase [Nanoarchaeota archaeon]|nr:Gfo/Idh/MocA family oxidoreductase [Nanoarchaeota archaeon]
MALDVLMAGTGEYTTGWVGEKSKSDKKKGVVALTLFDLRRQGLVEKLLMAGTNGTKFPAIRKHLDEQIAKVYKGLDTSFASFPPDKLYSDPKAYLRAMDSMQKGDAVIIFTPDDTHYEIAKAAVEKGMHVLLTKPPVKTLKQHLELSELAKKHEVLVDIEVHKRFDPLYRNAREEIRKQPFFSEFYSLMTQPRFQLETFRSWAGKSSDISYYLNSHHIDYHVWSMEGIARPTKVTASASKGIALGMGINTEDTITLVVEWAHHSDHKKVGVAKYVAGWADPTSDVHTQQGFECMTYDNTGNVKKIKIDQAHRGYTIYHEGKQVESRNPLYMDYNPDENGFFAGQNGYGYVSIAKFIEAVTKINNKEKTPAYFDKMLPTIARTPQLTAVLQAGRMSLDNRAPVEIRYDSTDMALPIGFREYKLELVEK